jgi:hypothetical protein
MRRIDAAGVVGVLPLSVFHMIANSHLLTEQPVNSCSSRYLRLG